MQGFYWLFFNAEYGMRNAELEGGAPAPSSKQIPQEKKVYE